MLFRINNLGYYAVCPLTTNADDFLGGVADDIINGGLANNGASDTYQTWDTIDGGAGTNILNVEVIAGNYSASLANIQEMNIQQAMTANAIATFGLGGLSSLTSLSLNGPQGFTINTLGSLPSISITGTTALNTLQFTSAALSPAGQTLNLNVDGVTGSGVTLVDIGTNALETVAITATGADSSFDALTFGTAAAAIGTTTLTISGEAGLTTSIVDAASLLRTINGSSATGNLSLTAIASSTVTTGSGNDTITSGGGIDNFSGGLGNDRFVFGAGLNNLDTVNGGDGNDSIWTTGAAASTYERLATQTITNVETLSITDAALPLELITQNIATGINTVELQDGTTAAAASAITMGAGAATVNVGRSAADAVQTLLNQLTISDTGTATTDTLTLANTAYNTATAAGLDAFNGQAVIVNGYETVNLNTGDTRGVLNTIGVVTLTGDVGAATALNISGNQSLTAAGAITATTINASTLIGATSIAAGVQGLVMNAAAAAGLTSVTGSAYADVLRGDASSSIAGGAGNDSIFGGTGADTLLGQEGNDTITGGGGNDSIDGGAGNDTVVETAANITVNDTIRGGEGTADILQLNDFAAALDGTALAGISEFEILDARATGNVIQLMTDFDSNPGFTQIRAQVTAGNTVTFNQVTSSVTTLGLAALNTTDTIVLDRLVDGSANSLTVNSRAAGVLGALTVNDEETLTFNTTQANANGTTTDRDTTITTLNATDLTSLTVNGGGAFTLTTNAIAPTALALATVNLSGSTGAININAGTSLANMTVTNGIGAMTFTAGAGNDAITGSEVADSLVGGAGADTLTGNGGNDTLVGGLGADSIVGGAGTNTYSGAGIVTGTDLDGGASAMTGQVINLGSTTLSAAAINGATGTNISSDLTSVATGQAAYLGAAATVSDRVDTLSSIQNVIGTSGADYIVGSAGNNVITGGLSADTITGGLGADTFVLTSNASEDTITDFTVSQSDVVSFDISDLGLDVAEYTAGAAVVLTVAQVLLLAAGGANNVIIKDTAAAIAAFDNVGGQFTSTSVAIETNTGKIMFSADSDYTGAPVDIANVTAAQGALAVAANFAFIA